MNAMHRFALWLLFLGVAFVGCSPPLPHKSPGHVEFRRGEELRIESHPLTGRKRKIYRLYERRWELTDEGWRQLGQMRARCDAERDAAIARNMPEIARLEERKQDLERQKQAKEAEQRALSAGPSSMGSSWASIGKSTEIISINNELISITWQIYGLKNPDVGPAPTAERLFGDERFSGIVETVAGEVPGKWE